MNGYIIPTTIKNYDSNELNNLKFIQWLVDDRQGQLWLQSTNGIKFINDPNNNLIKTYINTHSIQKYGFDIDIYEQDKTKGSLMGLNTNHDSFLTWLQTREGQSWLNSPNGQAWFNINQNAYYDAIRLY